jgi:hypothetical protein
MFPGAASEVVCYADIQGAVRPVGHDVDPSGNAKAEPFLVDGRLKAGRERK